MSDFNEMIKRLVDEAVRPLREEIAQLRAANIDPDALGPREAGQRWFGGVTAETVTGWIKAGHLQATEAPGGRYLIKREHRDEFHQRRRVKALRPAGPEGGDEVREHARRAFYAATGKG